LVEPTLVTRARGRLSGSITTRGRRARSSLPRGRLDSRHTHNLIIIRPHLYDTLLAMILPSIAFAIPLSVLVLSNFIRDVPRELFESMRLDGRSEWGTLWRLAFPLTRPALVTVTIYNGLQVWNNFLLPLILTTSPERRTLPLALWSFQGQYSVNVPRSLLPSSSRRCRSSRSTCSAGVSC
jgi:ABC-type spermidine/putrescine transport system permease subunit I